MKQFLENLSSLVKGMVYVLTAISGFGVLLMMVVTCADILFRLAGHPFIGAYDIIGLISAITIACALPYTTAVKGHVAIEYFFHQLSRRGRVRVDTITRLLSMTLFGLLVWRCILYGNELLASGNCTATLEIPIFWIMYVMAFACAVVVLVIFDHMIHPGKELIKP